jgi:hypothetical protein
MLRHHELVLIQLASAAPQPGHERLAKKRCARNRFHVTQWSGRHEDAITTARDEIAGRHRQLLVGADNSPGSPRQRDTKPIAIASRVNPESSDRKQLERSHVPLQVGGNDAGQLISREP